MTMTYSLTHCADSFDIAGAPDYECTNDPALYGNDTLPRCPSSVGTEVVPILMGFYILITNVLMLNLLIAMFR